MKTAELISLLDRLEMYARAGLPIDEVFMEQESVRAAIRSGKRLSVALADVLEVDPSIAHVIHSGESSGTLPQSLKACRTMLERRSALAKKIVSAMVYPVVIGLATVLLTIGLIEGVMPQVIPLLNGLHAKLPLITRIVIWLAHGFNSYGVYALGALIIAGVSCMILYKKYLPARRLAHRVLIRSPVLGSLAARHSLSMFFGTLGSMMEAGVPATDAYARAVISLSLLPIRETMNAKSEALMRGEAFEIIADPIVRGMPPYARPLIRAGEDSGNLSSCLSHIASILESELDHGLARMTALVEPALMIGMGGAVGSIALSIMMPIYGVSRALQS